MFRKKNKTWKDITIRQHMEMLPSRLKNKDSIEIIIHKLKVLCDMDEEDVLNMTQNDIGDILKKYEFMKESPSPKFKKHFKLKGQWYEVKPDIKDHKADNYMFCMDRLKTLSKDKETIDKNLHLFMAIVCHPVKKKYFHKKKLYTFVPEENHDVMKTAEFFYENLTMDIAYPISIFFWILSKSLTQTTEDFLTRKVEEINKTQSQIEKDLKSSLDG